MATPNNPIVNAGLSYVNQLQIRFRTSKSVTLFSGAARNSTNIADIILSADTIVDSAIVGANGIDFGTFAANTFYAVYVIGDSRGYSQTAGLFSLSPDAPIIPLNYDMFRRVGWVLTDGSANIISFVQSGLNESRNYYYRSSINVLAAGTATVFTLVNIAAAIPPIVENSIIVTTEALVTINYTPASAGNTAQFSFSTVLGISPIVQFGCGVAAPQFGTLTLPTFLREISYKVFAGDLVTLNVTGFTDYLE